MNASTLRRIPTHTAPARHRFPMRTAIAALAAIATLAAFGAGHARANPFVTVVPEYDGKLADPAGADFRLIGLTADGNAYVLDSGLTAEDCKAERDNAGLWKVAAALYGVTLYRCEHK